MSDRPEIEIQRQTAFGEDGELGVTETSVETSLEDFGADVDHRDRDSRLDRPEASEFGVDDRPEAEQPSEGDQSTIDPKLSNHPRAISRRSSQIRTRINRRSPATMRPLAVSSKSDYVTTHKLDARVPYTDPFVPEYGNQRSSSAAPNA